MSWFNDLLKVVGSFVDKLVPSGVGNRTRISVIACLVLKFATPIIPAEYAPLAQAAQAFLCGVAAPSFAVAGAVRDK